MKIPKGFWKSTASISLYSKGSLSSGDAEICPVAGVYNFDLYMDTALDCVFLRLAAERTKAIDKNTNLIGAYWLPWVSDKTAVLELKDDADFFFTSALGGCRIQIAGNQVAHIAGNKGRPKWREQQGKEFVESVGAKDLPEILFDPGLWLAGCQRWSRLFRRLQEERQLDVSRSETHRQ